jgi:hypothetical protein
VFAVFVQDPHDIGYRKPVMHEEIADGDFSFRDRVQGSRIPRARKHLLAADRNREMRKQEKRKWEDVRRNREPAGRRLKKTNPALCAGSRGL